MKLTIDNIFSLLLFRTFMSNKGALGKWKINFLKDKKRQGLKAFENKTRITILEVGDYLIDKISTTQMIYGLESTTTFRWEESIEGYNYWSDLFDEFAYIRERIKKSIDAPLYDLYYSMAIQIYKNLKK